MTSTHYRPVPNRPSPIPSPVHSPAPPPASASARPAAPDRTQAVRRPRRRHLRRLATTAAYGLVRGAAAAIGGGLVYWLLHH
jgi:hypothetical protein